MEGLATLTLGTRTLIESTKVVGGVTRGAAPLTWGLGLCASADLPSARTSNRFTDTVRAPGAEALVPAHPVAGRNQRRERG